jgi:hypothetical protein
VAEVAEVIVRAATAVAGPPPGAEPAAPAAPAGRAGARHVPRTAEDADASKPDDGSGTETDS